MLLVDNGGSDFFFFLDLGLVDGDFIGEEDGASVLSGGVIEKHDLDKNTHNSLFEEHVSHGGVNVVHSGLSGVHHISLLKFH